MQFTMDVISISLIRVLIVLYVREILSFSLFSSLSTGIIQVLVECIAHVSQTRVYNIVFQVYTETNT